VKIFIFGSVCLIFTSCGVYNTSFDCPPGKGIGCASVGEVLDLIIEREGGEDLFVYDKGSALLLKQREKLKQSGKNSSCLFGNKTKKLILAQDESGDLILIEEKD